MYSRLLCALFLILDMTIIPLAWSQIEPDPQDFGSEEIKKPAKVTPFSFESHLDAVAETKISKGFFKKDRVRFAEGDAELGMVVYHCPAYSEGVRLAISYTGTYLGWEHNPWFCQNQFNTLSLKIGGFTERLERWFWRGNFAINMDTDEWNANYTSYDILLWGRYAQSKNIGLHFGLWAQTGMRLDRVWPIIGADWQVSRNWKLNLVFPVNVSLEYALSKSWSIALAGRTFNSRHRVNRDQSSARSLIRYENIGAELMIKYEIDNMAMNIHAGSTLGGKYRIADPKNHHAHNYHLEPSGYIGGEVDMKF